MIESEEHRKRLFEIVERWCDHIKATPLLRSGDVGGLVSSIISEFYRITLSCGHEVKSFDEEVVMKLPEVFYDDDGRHEGHSVGSYCKDCADWNLKNIEGCEDISPLYKGE